MYLFKKNATLFDSTHLVSRGCHPVVLWGGVSIRPTLQRDWLPSADVDGGGEGAWGDVGEAAVGSALSTAYPAPRRRHHLLQLATNQVGRGRAEGEGRLQQAQARLVAQVGPPGWEAVAAQRVGVQRHLLQGGQRGEQLPGEEAQLVAVEEQGPQGGELTGGKRKIGGRVRGIK